MPTYEYVCRACGHEFERFQRMSEGSLRKCPKCGELRLQRLLGIGAGVIFKGSGFYETDYKRKGPNGKAGTAPSPAPESAKKETTPESTKDGSTKGDRAGTGKTED